MLLAAAEPPERFQFRLDWSAFRRRHQAVAKVCHSRRRARQQGPDLGPPSIHLLEEEELELTDERWERIAALLAAEQPRVGRPSHDHRRILSGLLWMIRTGSSWRDVPDEFGPWKTIRSRYDRWRRAGIWQQILDILKQDDTPDAS